MKYVTGKSLRQFLPLLVVVLITAFFSVALPKSKKVSAGLTTLWNAPQGPGRSNEATRWLAELRDVVSRPRSGCDPITPPDLSLTKPARAFQIKVEREPLSGGSPIVYLQDPIAELFIVVASDAKGCPTVSFSGRGAALAQRDVLSPFPYARLPGLPDGATITAVVQDVKAIRPWILLADESVFARDNAILWAGLGVYSGILLMMIIVALGFDAYAGSRVALSYAFYCFTLQIWLVQNFGIDSALIPFWPGPNNFPILQAFSVAAVVLGVGFAVLEFLQFHGRKRAVLGGLVGLSALLFLSSAWQAAGYRAGAALLFSLALTTIIFLGKSVFRGDTSIRLFTLGLAATMVGGGIQAFSIVATGISVPRLAAFAFPIGSLVQAAFWLAALIIRRQQELQEMRAEQAQARLADTVRQVSMDLNSTLELPEVLDRLLGHVSRFVYFDRAVVFALDNDQMRVVASRGFKENLLPSSPVPLDNYLFLATIARSGEQVLSAKESGSRESHYLGLAPVSSWLAVPLRVRDQVIGILAMERWTGHDLTERDLSLVNTFTGTAGVAAQNARLFGETRRLATTDALTGIFNRAHFFHLAEHEMRRSRRLKAPVSVLMADLDHFKQINDRYGHQAGDLVLAKVGECLKKTVRGMDILGRYGGEEFSALLPQTSPELAREAGERIRRAVEELHIQFNGVEIPLSISIGVAGRTSPEELTGLLKAADAALYRAKDDGRNRVVVDTEAKK